MNIGMLWFDNDPKTGLDAKVMRAADFFRKKYGRVPDACMVSPAMLAEPEHKVGLLTVKPWRRMAPGHLWIGMADEPKQVG
jgi:hypothetical protein